MRRVRVGVIDSGVAVGHPHVGPVAGGVTIRGDGHVAEGLFADELGHGTAVMAAIQEKAPDAEYFAVRLFERSLRTSATALRVAMEWCLAHETDVINLSLGTVNAAHATMFRQAVLEASEAGVLIVAARENDGQACYPGCLPGVFAVDADALCPRQAYRMAGALRIEASPYPRPVPGVPPERNLQGVSFAVANATGFVARACEALPGRESGARRAELVSAALAESRL